MAAIQAARLLGVGLLGKAEVNAARIAGGATADELKLSYALRMLIQEGGEDDQPVPEDITLPVSSSAISSISWRSDGIIGVTFKRGGTYTYDGTYETFIAFAASPSKGAFFNQHFK